MPSRRHALLGLTSLTGLLAAAPALAHPHHTLREEQHGDVERQLMTFRIALKDAVAARDGATLRAAYADGFVHTHPSGKMDGKDARIVALVAGEPVIETAPAAELAIRLHGPDLAVMTGRSLIPGGRDGRPSDIRWTQVYTRTAGHWQLAASHATRLPAVS